MSVTEVSKSETKTPSGPKLPASSDLVTPASITDRGLDKPGDRNTVFGSLVTEDSDVVGLVAYSIYKQNKHDFLVAFSKTKGREPNEAELSAYTMGESTPRRLAIFRHLAQATLDGRGPDSPAIPGGAKKAPVKDVSSLNTKLLGVAIMLMLVTLAYLMTRLGLPGGG
ncbi:MAG: hypothetical protein Q8M31_11845 [Beijerinckiaceae bacterium]|nr:hypothetical protein [Beijerinckiaceae bacterium]